MKQLPCPTPGEVKQILASGRNARAEEVEEHVLACDLCLAVLKESIANDESSTLFSLQGRRAGDMGGKSEVLDRLVASILALPSSAGAAPVHEEIHHLDILSAPQAPDELGRLAHYRVLRPVGSGGMGIVYEAEDLNLGRRVALKVLKPHLLAEGAGRKRFLQEARAAPAIEHDHIVAIHEVGEANKVPYLAMPLLQGCTLDTHLKSPAPMPLADVLGIGCRIALGLAAAHAQGLIHRDIKPANIWLETRGQESGGGKQGSEIKPRDERGDSRGFDGVKILDFGLARTESPGAHLTQSGVVVGTPGFMAPEQVDRGPVDHRCDLFSLGCVLYLMATGRQPWEGTGTMNILRAMAVNQPTPPITLRPELPRPLSDLICRLLEKDPARRPKSAQAVAAELAALQALLERGGRTGNPRFARKRMLARIAAGAAGLLALWGVAGVFFLQTPDGAIRVEVNDPKIKVTLDDGRLIVNGAGEKEIAITPGDKSLHIERDGFAFDTKQFALRKGDKLRFSVAWREGKIVVRKDEAAFDEAGRPKEPMAAIELKSAFPAPAKAPFDAKQARAYQVAWAKHLDVPIEYQNTLGMTFVLIPPGEFLMGVEPNDIHLDKLHPTEKPDGYQKRAMTSAMPRHQVRITRPFYMQTHEVRIRWFQEVLKRVPKDNDPTKADYAVNPNVSWYDAIEFCDALSNREGKTPAHHTTGKVVTRLEGATGYRLPTEAEWEFACRAGTHTHWFFGNDPHGPNEASGLLRAYQWGLSNPAPKANPFGLFDMYGGSAEWCWDAYAPYTSVASLDPAVAPNGKVGVVRGGSAYCSSGGDAFFVNSFARFAVDLTDKVSFGYVGFGRIVLPVEAVRRSR